MPAIVDHEKRRLEVARVAARLIIRSGLEAVTVRDIAAEAGYSTAVVSHYFRNKRELLLIVFRTVLEEATSEVERLRQSGADLQTCIAALLPLDDKRRGNWLIWFAFWGKAMTDPEFRAEQQQRGRESRQMIERLLSTTPGPFRDSGGDREMQSRRLLATLAGLATQGTFDPDDWPAERQCAVMAAEIAALAAEVGVASSA